jgi:hypothetical protein
LIASSTRPHGRIPIKKERSQRAVAVLELLTGLGISLFWVGFFTVGLAPENPPTGYFVYEHSFPLPDSILALALIIAALLLLKGKPLGRSVSLAAAGGLIFLGTVDFFFNIQNGMYAISALDTLLNGFINLWCVGFGVFLFFRFRN